MSVLLLLLLLGRVAVVDDGVSVVQVEECLRDADLADARLLVADN